MQCVDYESSAETIRLKCEINSRFYINFDHPAYGEASLLGELYEFDLDCEGVMYFGKKVPDTQRWRTDLHDVDIRIGKSIKVQSFGPIWNYEIVEVE